MFQTITHVSDGQTLLKLSGEFNETDIEEIRNSFRKGGILSQARTFKVEAGEKFRSNGSDPLMARFIRRFAGDRKIICRDPRLIHISRFFKN